MSSFFSSLIPVANGMYPIVMIDQAQNENDTVKQGKNYLLASKPQMILLSAIFTNLQSITPLWTNRSGLVNGTLTIATITTTIVAISSVADYYLGLYISPYIERVIGARTNNFLKHSVYPILLDHSGNLAHVAAAGVSIAKYALGNQKEAITSFVFLGIGYFDRKGYLPFRVSAFYNKQLAIVASVAGFILGSPLTKFVCAIDICFKVLPVILDRLKFIVDAGVCNRMGKAGIHYPSLYSLESGPNVKRNKPILTKDEFLNFKDNTPLYINPSHIADKPNIDVNTKDVKYDSLLTMFDAIDWKDEQASSALVARLKQDERFLDALKKEEIQGVKDIFEIISTLDAITLHESTINRLKEASNEEAVKSILMSNKFLLVNIVKTNRSINGFVDLLETEIKNLESTLANNIRYKKNAKITDIMTDEEKKILVQWTRNQLACFIDNLSGKKRPKGALDGYNETQNTGVLCIKHLQNISEQLKSNPDKMLSAELQDNILKLSIEGGDYCVVAITRVVKEMFTTFVSTTNSEGVDLKGRISFSLSKKRQEIGQELSRLLLSTRPGMQEMVNGDVHYIHTIIVSFFRGLGIDMTDMETDLAVEKSPITEAITTVLFPFARAGFWYNAYPSNDLSEDSMVTLDEFIGKFERKFNNLPRNDTFIQKTKKLWGVVKEGYLEAFGVAQSFLKDTYTKDVLIEAFESMIKLKAISNQDMTNWWQNYIVELGGDDANDTIAQHIYGSLMYDGDDTSIPGMITLDENGKTTYSRKCLEIMLLEMGFLQRAPVKE